MIRDGQRAFFGSQSLRRLELDTRREIGVIVTDGPVVQKMQRVFEEDWALTESGKRTAKAIEEANAPASDLTAAAVA